MRIQKGIELQARDREIQAQLPKDELELQARDKEIQAQLRKDELEWRKSELEIEKQRMEFQHALELAKIQNASSVTHSPVHVSGKDMVTSDTFVGLSKSRIDVITKMMPKFDPTDVDLFFTSFERTLKLNKIPKDQWPVILNAIVFGKAQRVLASLSLDEIQDYDL